VPLAPGTSGHTRHVCYAWDQNKGMIFAAIHACSIVPD